VAQPDNPKLYNSLLAQAKAKFPSHKPNGLSYPAAKWFGQEYARQGGGYVDSIKQVDPKLRDYKVEAEKKEKTKEENKKRAMKKRGLVV
jgi:hypothetical protein